MKLAVHIIRYFRENKDYFSPAKLRESTAMVTLHFGNQDTEERAQRRLELLRAIYDVADLERDYCEGGVGEWHNWSV